MKDKPLAIIITLLGGAVCSICCILKGVGLLWTLLTTLITLLVFLLIGLIVNRNLSAVKKEYEEAEKERKEMLEAERLREAELLEARNLWEQEHPGEPFPEDIAPKEENPDKEGELHL